MASGAAAPYYDGTSSSTYRYGCGYGDGYSRPTAPSATSSFHHLCLFLATASLLGAASLYSRLESAVESLFDQLRLVTILSPLLLLLAAQYWSAARRQSPPRGEGGLSSLPVAAPLAVGEQPSWYVDHHRQQDQDGAGASSPPWGVALALALVLLLISYQSCFQDWWFPLVSRRRR